MPVTDMTGFFLSLSITTSKEGQRPQQWWKFLQLRKHSRFRSNIHKQLGAWLCPQVLSICTSFSETRVIGWLFTCIHIIRILNLVIILLYDAINLEGWGSQKKLFGIQTHWLFSVFSLEHKWSASFTWLKPQVSGPQPPDNPLMPDDLRWSWYNY